MIWIQSAVLGAIDEAHIAVTGPVPGWRWMGAPRCSLRDWDMFADTPLLSLAEYPGGSSRCSYYSSVSTVVPSEQEALSSLMVLKDVTESLYVTCWSSQPVVVSAAWSTTDSHHWRERRGEGEEGDQHWYKRERGNHTIGEKAKSDE